MSGTTQEFNNNSGSEQGNPFFRRNMIACAFVLPVLAGFAFLPVPQDAPQQEPRFSRQAQQNALYDMWRKNCRENFRIARSRSRQGFEIVADGAKRNVEMYAANLKGAGQPLGRCDPKRLP